MRDIKAANLSLYFIVVIMMVLIINLIANKNNGINASSLYMKGGAKQQATDDLQRFSPNPMMKLDMAIESVISQRCLAGLKGVECPDNWMNKRNVPESTLNLLFAGVGYDSYGHSVKPQILNSHPVFTFETPRRNSYSMSMTDPRAFYSLIYPITGQQTFYNGLYTYNGGADEIFTKFFDGRLNVMNAQEQITSHQAAVISNTDVTFGFSRIIDILPNEMDAEMYGKVIEYFGDSVMTLINFGGVVDSTVSVRSCFSDPAMEAYVRNQLSAILLGQDAQIPVGYIKYHKLSQLDIAGGNPEIDNIPQRVQTFRYNPVPIKFDTIPIWQVFPEGPKRNNMKAIYDSYVQSKGNMVENMINRLNELKYRELLKPQSFVAYARRKSTNKLFGIGSGYIGVGETLDIAGLNYRFFTQNFEQKQGKTTIRLFRHDVNLFHMEAIQTSPASAAYGQLQTPTLVSNTVGYSCAYIPYSQPPQKQFQSFIYDDPFTELFVCSGCQAFLTNEGAGLRCDCPTIE